MMNNLLSVTFRTEQFEVCYLQLLLFCESFILLSNILSIYYIPVHTSLCAYCAVITNTNQCNSSKAPRYIKKLNSSNHTISLIHHVYQQQNFLFLSDEVSFCFTTQCYFIPVHILFLILHITNIFIFLLILYFSGSW